MILRMRSKILLVSAAAGCKNPRRFRSKTKPPSATVGWLHTVAPYTIHELEDQVWFVSGVKKEEGGLDKVCKLFDSLIWYNQQRKVLSKVTHHHMSSLYQATPHQ